MLLEVQKASGETPRALQKRPVLRDDCHDYVAAFYLAAGGRQHGYGGPQALLTTEIQGALSFMEIARHSRMSYLKAIRVLDQAFMEHTINKQEATK